MLYFQRAQPTFAIPIAKVMLLFELRVMKAELFSPDEQSASSLNDCIQSFCAVLIGDSRPYIGFDAKLGVLHLGVEGGTG